MARRKTRKKKKSRPRLDISGFFARIHWPLVTRGSVVTIWLVGIGAIIWGWIWGVPRLEAFAIERQRARTGAVEVNFLHTPAWMKDDLLLSLTLAARKPFNFDQVGGNEIWDTCDTPEQVRDALDEVRDALLAEGWFDSIEQVRLVRGDLIEVDATFVVPYAVVRDRDGDHLIDHFGRILPRSYCHGCAPQFIAITGAHFSRPQQWGEEWEGTDVTAALRLLRTIEHQTWRGQVGEVDVSTYHDDQSLSLYARNGNRIIWGSPPGEEQALEALADFKLHLLDEQFNRSGLIDGGFTTLDLTLQEGSFRR
ncbi:MAG: hypothetical protein JSV91_01565 [Phycisphaerales bacterium]|nr:MAG: hypothetical protein JSV91_01565 [Phycisphaerales bacterium]